jgi:NitT/TauT family transport system substrate-binding protein
MKFFSPSRFRVLGCGASLVSLMLLGVVTAAEARAETKVVLAVDGIAVLRNLPVLLADHLGYFKDEGLSVTLMETSANAKVDDMLTDGRVTGMVAYYHHTIVAQAEGRDCEAVITMAVTPGYELLIANHLKGSVTRLSELKGKRIISGGPHSAKSTSANWLMLQQGFKITDYTAIAPTTRAKMAEALKTGEADFIIAPEPDAGFYEKQGVASLFADLYSVEGTRKSLGDVFPSTVLYMSTGYASAHPELTTHLVKAFSRALQFINARSVAEIAAQVPEIATGEGKESRVIAQGVKMFATDGVMPDSAARMEAQALVALFPEYAQVAIAKTYTNDFINAALKK